MNISRPTFTRVYKKARKAIARALVEGKAIIIEGGTYISENYWARCKKCSRLTTAPTPLKNCPHCHSAELSNIHLPE
jgi:Zn finger protein HypA/HybF involved in hydrogenase expression